jgi:hypothetical protein
MRWVEYVVFLVIVVGLASPVGRYLARVCQRRRTFLDPVLRPVESALYRLLGVRPEQEMSAGVYIVCFLLFGAGCGMLLLLVLIFQRWLPWGPADAYLTTPMTKDLAANTAVSFTTTTTWQAYGGENTLRYLAQVMGLVAQNFLAGAAGLAAGFAFIRGMARERSATIGNFWVDLIRSLLWVLLPLTLLGPRSDLAGCPAEHGALYLGSHAGGPDRDHRAGPSSGPGVHQEFGHQWRRLLQRQWCASLCESDAAHQLSWTAGDGCAARFAHDHFWPNHAPAACRLGVADGHGGAVPSGVGRLR